MSFARLFLGDELLRGYITIYADVLDSDAS